MFSNNIIFVLVQKQFSLISYLKLNKDTIITPSLHVLTITSKTDMYKMTNITSIMADGKVCTS